MQQVGFRADGGGDLGNQLLADAVQGRVGDLGEQLLEIIVQQARTVGQHGQGRIGPHRPHGFFPVAGHGRHQYAQFLVGITERLLALHQGIGVGAVDVLRVGQVFQGHQVPLQPAPVGMFVDVALFQFTVVDDPAFPGVHQEDTPGVQALLELDVLRGDVQHAHLGGHDHHVVMGDVIARRAQAVPVQYRADDFAVGEGNGGGTVPGFHQAGVVFVKCLALLAHGFVTAPGLRDHHQDGVGQRAAGHVQELHDVVEHCRVAAAFDDDRKNFLQVRAEQFGIAQRLPRVHPVGVAAHRIDLAVMAHVAERVGQAPGRKGVGGKALVHQGQGRFYIRVGDLREHGFELGAGQHALVDEGAPGQGRDIEQVLLLHIRIPDGVFHPLADDVQFSFKGRRVGN